MTCLSNLCIGLLYCMVESCISSILVGILTWVHMMGSKCLENSDMSVMTDLMNHFGDLCKVYVHPHCW